MTPLVIRLPFGWRKTRAAVPAFASAGKVGDRLTISTPNNLFALIPSARKHLFIAGGIGITPFLSHMAELQHSDVDWQLHYCSRNPESCAFRDELVQHPQAEKVHLHHSSTGTRLELARLLADIEPAHTFIPVAPRR